MEHPSSFACHVIKTTCEFFCPFKLFSLFPSNSVLGVAKHASSLSGVVTGRWAIVKDPVVAENMAKFIENSTIGVCRDAQVRAAGLLRATIKGYTWSSRTSPTYHSWDVTDLLANRKFFHYGMVTLAERWAKVRLALAGNPMFTLPPISQPARCSFLRIDYPNLPGTKLKTSCVQIINILGIHVVDG
jgi:hypothetical protein